MRNASLFAGSHILQLGKVTNFLLQDFLALNSCRNTRHLKRNWNRKMVCFSTSAYFVTEIDVKYIINVKPQK